MLNNPTCLGLLALILGLPSCTPVPNLEPKVEYVEIAKQINQASLIVVGIVKHEKVVRAAKDPNSLELRQVTVLIEATLEGLFKEKQLTFYYFGEIGGWDGPPPNFITPGARCIFYLVKDGTVWRATTDAYLSHTRIFTGRHNIPNAGDKDQVRQTIARLMLLPGEGADLEGYPGGSVYQNKALAMRLVGKVDVSKLLRSLLENPNPTIRGRACIMLAQFPLNELSCLDQLLLDPQTSPTDRKDAEKLMHPAPNPLLAR